MLRRSPRTEDDQEIEDLGVFEYLDDEAPRFVAAPPPARRRAVYDEALLARLRLELPMLWAWIACSCFFTDPVAWMVWGLGLVAVNCWLRPAYAQRGLVWLFRVYLGVGLGQVALGLSRLWDLTAIQPLLGLYVLGLMVVWIVLELRYQNRQPPEPMPYSEDDQVYYYYG